MFSLQRTPHHALIRVTRTADATGGGWSSNFRAPATSCLGSGFGVSGLLINSTVHSTLAAPYPSHKGILHCMLDRNPYASNTTFVFLSSITCRMSTHVRNSKPMYY